MCHFAKNLRLVPCFLKMRLMDTAEVYQVFTCLFLSSTCFISHTLSNCIKKTGGGLKSLNVTICVHFLNPKIILKMQTFELKTKTVWKNFVLRGSADRTLQMCDSQINLELNWNSFGVSFTKWEERLK